MQRNLGRSVGCDATPGSQNDRRIVLPHTGYGLVFVRESPPYTPDDMRLVPMEIPLGRSVVGLSGPPQAMLVHQISAHGSMMAVFGEKQGEFRNGADQCVSVTSLPGRPRVSTTAATSSGFLAFGAGSSRVLERGCSAVDGSANPSAWLHTRFQSAGLR